MSDPYGAVRTAPTAPPGDRPAGARPVPGADLDELVAATLRPARQVRAALPPETSGWDPERLACVSVDPQGMPVGVRVVDGWQHRAAPAALGAAVTAAGRAAARALDARVLGAFERATGQADTARKASDPAGDGLAGAQGRAAPGAASRRPLGEVAEDSIASLAAVNRALFPADDARVPEGVALALDGGVEVRVGTGGLVACVLRGMRVAAASGHALSGTLTLAVRAARVDLDRRLAEVAPPQHEALLAEVLAYLTSPELAAERPRPGGHP